VVRHAGLWLAGTRPRTGRPAAQYACFSQETIDSILEVLDAGRLLEIVDQLTNRPERVAGTHQLATLRLSLSAR
jgi:hypothetical protein